MKISVLDACFPIDNQSEGMAAIYLKWIVGKCGSEVVNPSESDVIFVTCVDPRNAKYIEKVRKKYPSKFIVAGGAGALAPYSLGKAADVVCVGSGDKFISTMLSNGIDSACQLDNAWIDGEKRAVSVAGGFPWDLPPIEAEDGAFRLWCGVGCKKKCAFCQTGWSVPYEENDNPSRLLKQIKALQRNGKKFAYLSNDPTQHSFFKNLPSVGHGSFSLQYIKKYGLPNARQIRLGVEGVSEKLRSLVNKPISHDDLVKSAIWLNNNKKSVRWFMIAGLPGETQEDWVELRQAVQDWKRHCEKGVLALSFTAWQPEPATPFGIMPINDDYEQNFDEFKAWFFDGIGWSNRIKLMKPAGAKNRLESAVYRMGLSEKQVRIGGNWGQNDRVEYPYKKARNAQSKAIWERLYG
jgi:radical SAM superfamily enzyme YgiQ (UPF0313 family)